MLDSPSTLRIAVQDRQRFPVQAIHTLPQHATAPVPCQVIRLDERCANLTDCEVQVLGAIGAGATTRGVANLMGISPETVEDHKRRIFSKLGAQNKSHAVAVALRRGLLNPSTALTGSAA